MEWWLLLTLIFLALVSLMATGMVIAMVFMVMNIIGLMWIAGGIHGLAVIPGSIFSGTSTFSLLAVPMFFLLGAVLFHARIIQLVMDVTNVWIGKVRARLLFVSLFSGTGLAMLSGAGTADTALIASTLYPEMEKQGYHRNLSLGTIVSSGLLAAIIPPSALAVLLGSLAEINIGALLLAGLFPGLMMVTMYIIYVSVRVAINPSLAPTYPSETVPLTTKLMMTLKITPLGIIIFTVMGFILLGITTPSEAAVTGALGAMLVTALYGRLTMTTMKNALFSVARVFGMFFLIIAGAISFGQFIAQTGAAASLLEWVVGLDMHPIAILIIMQLVIVILGLFMSQLPIMLIAIPIFAPIVEAFGWDPIWFWIMFLMNMAVGAETPPFGFALFVVKGVLPKHVSMGDIYKAQIPYVIMDITAIGIIIAFPQIALWLPNQMI
ncbi:MAG: C4-dicarboxylate ABC transporter permease [Chloroflexi bacterium]|nr:C4-dicarboxylate ABC transporter permease [Chloroflexota bacterium]